MIDTPECDKMLAVKDESQAIGEFLDWLSSQGIVLACYYEERGLAPNRMGIQELLAKYYDIDLDKAEQEKQAVLELQRELNYTHELLDGILSGAVDVF